jgi:hypothetical protein
MKPATMLTFVVVNVIAAVHLLRLIVRLEVRVGGAVVPIWFSVVGLAFFASLAVGLWREHKPRQPAA